MAGSIVALITDTLTGLVSGLASLPITMFNTIIWDSTAGELTDFAQYALVFAFAGIVLTVVTKLFKVV